VTPPSRDVTVRLDFDGEVEVRGRMTLVVTYRATEIFGPPTNQQRQVSSTFDATARFDGDRVTIEYDFVF
jgi:hypothetical protein